MFEGRKIKKLLTELSVEDSEQEQSRVINQLKTFGKDVFPHAIDAIKARKITSHTITPLLERCYDKSHFNELVTLTGDSFDVLRALAKHILLKKGGEGTIPALIQNLQSPNLYLKNSAVEILCSLKSSSCVTDLVSLFNGGRVEVKKNVIRILSEIGGNMAVKLLISALKDKDWSIRVRAAKALNKMKDPLTVDPMIEILSEKDPQMIKNAMDTLTSIGDKKAAGPMLALLKDQDIMIRQKAVDFLCDVGDAKIIPQLMTYLKDNDVNVRRCAVEILNHIKDPDTGEELVRAMKDSDWWVREIATDALAEIKGENVIKIIKAMLKDKDENMRRCAVEFFNKVSDPSAIEPIIDILQDTDWWVREKAISALGRFKDVRAIKPLVALKNDEEIKWAIPSALANIGHESVIEPLISFMRDNQKAVRLETIKALSNFNNEKVVEALKEGLGDKDKEIRNEAVKSLKKLTGKIFSSKIKPAVVTNEAGWKPSKVDVPEGAIITEAILVVDLCNSTGISDKYGNQFALELTKVLTNIAHPISEREKFQYMKSTGDGFLLTFPTINNAVAFAVSLAKSITEYNKTVDETRNIKLRFAINFGETRVDAKGDRLSLATNMTFRVEGVKDTALIELDGGIKKEEMPGDGRILLTETVAQEANNIAGIKTRLLGLFELKGISGLHRVFELTYD